MVVFTFHKKYKLFGFENDWHRDCYSVKDGKLFGSCVNDGMRCIKTFFNYRREKRCNVTIRSKPLVLLMITINDFAILPKVSTSGKP